ncbi:MAG: hypothetical protein V3V08_23390 [Nannocystaceae bacterium]
MTVWVVAGLLLASLALNVWLVRWLMQDALETELASRNMAALTAAVKDLRNVLPAKETP